MKQRVQSTAKKQGTELEGHWLWGRVATSTFLSFSFLSFLPLFCLSYSNTSSYWIWGAPPLLRYLWRCSQKLEAGKCATAMPVICPNELQRCGSKVNKQINRKDGNWEERMRREEETSGKKKRGKKTPGWNEDLEETWKYSNISKKSLYRPHKTHNFLWLFKQIFKASSQVRIPPTPTPKIPCETKELGFSWPHISKVQMFPFTSLFHFKM